MKRFFCVGVPGLKARHYTTRTKFFDQNSLANTPTTRPEGLDHSLRLQLRSLHPPHHQTTRRRISRNKCRRVRCLIRVGWVPPAGRSGGEYIIDRGKRGALLLLTAGWSQVANVWENGERQPSDRVYEASPRPSPHVNFLCLTASRIKVTEKFAWERRPKEETRNKIINVFLFSVI